MLKLKGKSLEWSLNHINKYNDTYIFPRPFEFDAINDNWKDVKDYLMNLDIYAEGIRPYRTELTAKSQVGFRICTQLDPLDSIVYNAIIYEICKELECCRIKCSDKKVFSFRLAPQDDGTLYDPDYNWDTFNEQARLLLNREEYKFVIVTDIADFYPSIYLHNIETHLRECVKVTGKSTHAETLINMIRAMNANQTHKGLPIGPQFSRPIAEIVLNQVDQILVQNDIEFIRYVDDYRIYCKSEQEAYRTLAFLAQKLYDVLNLKLNEKKTNILKSEDFQRQYLRIFKEEENDRILQDFYKLCSEIGISTSSYDDIDIESLTPEDRDRLKELNILELLMDEVTSENVDLGFVKFLIGNLARFDNTDVADYILKEEVITKVFPILRSIIGYLERVRSFEEDQKHLIGNKVLKSIHYSFIGELEFNRSWLLYLFTKGEEWDNKDKFIDLIKKFDDNVTLRELILCLGRSKNLDYFRENKLKNISTFDPWVRRSFITAISCLPKDERTPFYKSRSFINRDFLDKIIEIWAQKNHF